MIKNMLNKIQIQTVSTCNANCVFCPYVESWHKANPGKMEKKLYVKLLNDLETQEELEWLCPYLMNEPLTDPRIFDWIDMFYDKYPDKGVEIAVNPSLLDEKIRKKMVDTFKGHKHLISLSFHGVNQGTFEYITQLPWKICYQNAIDIFKENIDDLKVVLRGVGANTNNTVLYFTDGQYHSFWRDTCTSYGLEPSKVTYQISRFHDRAGQIQRTERNANKNNFGIVRKIGPKDEFYCIRLNQVLHVRWNGNVAACCMDYKNEIDTLGNLSEMTIDEYWNTEAYQTWYNMSIGKIESPEDWICARCISPGG